MKKHTPAAQRSHAKALNAPGESISGAQKQYVPSVLEICARDFERSSFAMEMTSRADSSLKWCATPKSAIFTDPSRARRTLSGLRSRCATWCRCRYLSPAAISKRYAAPSAGGSAPSAVSDVENTCVTASNVITGPKVTSSKIRYSASSSVSSITSCRLTRFACWSFFIMAISRSTLSSSEWTTTPLDVRWIVRLRRSTLLLKSLSANSFEVASLQRNTSANEPLPRGRSSVYWFTAVSAPSSYSLVDACTGCTDDAGSAAMSHAAAC
mmetsp:Transcript_27716/g.93128  ORF Transcript_27716/g.93128 Transcript_27716/m.93128 type:complete len:268 (-) Transcript_27716:156-959(-)